MSECSKFVQQSLKGNTLSGLAVALVLAPEAIAFAFIAGVNPMLGLYTAFVIGLVSRIIAGHPGMITGATSAIAVVMVSLVSQHGIQYLFAAVILAALLQIVAAIFNLNKFIHNLPNSVMAGLVNGLAIGILLSQFSQLNIPNNFGELIWMQGTQLYLMLGLVSLTMAIVYFIPKLTQAVPSPLVAIVTVTLITLGLDLNTQNVLDFLRAVSGNETATLVKTLPTFSLPDVTLSYETFFIILPYSLILAAVGLIESFATDEITTTRSRLFSVAAAIGLVVFILFASSLIELIPIAVLVGILFMAVIGGFEWASFNLARRAPKQELLVMMLVTLVTLLIDFTIAVIISLIISALIFAWEHSKYIYASSTVNQDNSKEYRIHGPLFLSSVANFLDLFDAQNDPNEVMVDFSNSRVSDYSAINAIKTLIADYKKEGKTLHLRHLSQDCRQRLKKAGCLVEISHIQDANYKVLSGLSK